MQESRAWCHPALHRCGLERTFAPFWHWASSEGLSKVWSLSLFFIWMDIHLKHFEEPLCVHLPGWELEFALDPYHSFFWGGISQWQGEAGDGSTGAWPQESGRCPRLVTSSKEELTWGGTSRLVSGLGAEIQTWGGTVLGFEGAAALAGEEGFMWEGSQGPALQKLGSPLTRVMDHR